MRNEMRNVSVTRLYRQWEPFIVHALTPLDTNVSSKLKIFSLSTIFYEKLLNKYNLIDRIIKHTDKLKQLTLLLLAGFVSPFWLYFFCNVCSFFNQWNNVEVINDNLSLMYRILPGKKFSTVSNETSLYMYIIFIV